MKSLLITHPDCNRHAMPGHPECPERLISVMDHLRHTGIVDDMLERQAEEASDDDLCLAHPEAFVHRIETMESPDRLVRVDADTYISPGSIRAARLAAGACATATRMVLDGHVDNAFCAIRPPGHHAEMADAMGFCLFNNIAVAARTALSRPGIERVAILDFDVHHCNGTVDIFKDDERVLVCSSFQKQFYPNRYLHYSNDHIVITPLDAGTAGAEFRRRVEADWLPAIEKHKPQFIFISAGFDAHHEDPVGWLELQDADYGWVTGFINAMAQSHANGRVVSTMEGGYDLHALARSAAVHVQTLVSGDQPR